VLGRQGEKPLATRRSRQRRCHLSDGTWEGGGRRLRNGSRSHRSLEKEAALQQGVLDGGLKEPLFAPPGALGSR